MDRNKISRKCNKDTSPCGVNDADAHNSCCLQSNSAFIVHRTAEVKHPSKFKNQPNKVGVTFMHSSPPCLCSSTIICLQWGRVFQAYRKGGILESLTQVGPGRGEVCQHCLSRSAAASYGSSDQSEAPLIGREPQTCFQDTRGPELWGRTWG